MANKLTLAPANDNSTRRHFSPPAIKPSLADYLSQSPSNDPDIERH
jgi:hypothetical protein